MFARLVFSVIVSVCVSVFVSACASTDASATAAPAEHEAENQSGGQDAGTGPAETVADDSAPGETGEVTAAEPDVASGGATESGKLGSRSVSLTSELRSQLDALADANALTKKERRALLPRVVELIESEPFASGADEFRVLLDVEEIAAELRARDVQRALLEECIAVEARDDLRGERWSANASHRLAELLDSRRDAQRVLELREESVAILRRLPEVPADELFVFEVDLWRALDRLERQPEADACLAALVETAQRLERFSDSYAMPVLIEFSLDLETERRHREAVALQRKALELFDESELTPATPGFSILLESLAGNEFASGDPKAARLTLERILELRQSPGTIDVDGAWRTRTQIAQCDLEIGDYDAVVRTLGPIMDTMPESWSADHPIRVACATALAQALAERGDVEEALARASALLAVLEAHRAPTDPIIARTRILVTGLTAELGDADTAYAAYKAYVDRIVADPNASVASIAEARENLAIAAMGVNRPEEALLLMQAVDRERATIFAPDDPARLTAAQNLGVVLGALGRFEEARELEERVLATRLQQLEPTAQEVIDAKINLAVRCSELGAFDRARELRREVLASIQARYAKKSKRVLEAMHAVALADREAGDFESARELYEELYAHYGAKKSRDRSELHQCMHDLAWTHHLMGDSAQAIRIQSQLLDELRATLAPRDVEVLVQMQNLANMRLGAGDLAGAESLAEEALTGLESVLGPGSPPTRSATALLAIVHKSEGDFAAAAELEERLLEDLRADPEVGELVELRATANLANTYFVAGRPLEALELGERVLARRLELLPADHPDIVLSRVAIAGVLQAQGAYARALEHLDGACATVRQRTFSVTTFSVAALVNRYSVLTRARTDFAAGEELAVIADAIEDALVPMLAASPRAVREWQTTLLTTLSALAGLDDRALQGGEAQLMRAVETLRSAVTERADMRRALSARTEAEEVQRELGRVVRTIASRAQFMPSGAEALAAWERDVRELVERRDRLQTTLLEGVAESEHRAVSIEAIASSLSEGDYYVSYLVHGVAATVPGIGASAQDLTSILSAFVVDRHGGVKLVRLTPVEKLEAMVARWRAAIGSSAAVRAPGLGISSPSDVDPRLAGEELRQLLLDPILEHTPGATTLHIVPDGAVHLVPIDALPVGDAGVVGDALRIRLLVDVRGLTPSATEANEAQRLVVMGGIDYDVGEANGSAATTFATFAPLPGAAAEARAVAALREQSTPTSTLLLEGAQATKARVAAELPGSRFVHIASHGWHLEIAEDGDALVVNPRVPWRVIENDGTSGFARGFLPESLCGVALAGANQGPDGILTAEELALLDLSGCRLAVLSACDTNVGVVRAGQSIQSLKFALHAAGVRTSITSLWPVDDSATQQLFEQFYMRLWSEGSGPAEALWQAKSVLRARGRPPLEWAGWVLTGDIDWSESK